MPVMCSICQKVFSTQNNCNRHITEVHEKVPKPVSYGKDSIWRSRCLEPNCDSAFTTNKNLMEHLYNIHSIKFETELHSLENMKDFNNWKSEIESANNCCYILKSKYTSTTGEVIYYKCNRSKTNYKIKETEQRSRRLKSQGSCKMSSSCTSEIKIVMETNKILIEWQKVHYGHDIELQHIRLPKIEKQNIVTKLVNGVSSQRILETTCKEIGEHLNRIDLLTSRDLRNIKNTISTVKEVHHISEELSALPEEPQYQLNEKILNIKAMAAKLQNFDFKQLENETISKIHYHLLRASNLTKCPKICGVNRKFEIKKRLIDPQSGFTSTKKKRVEAGTSLKRDSAQEAKIIHENLTNINPKDYLIFKSVSPLNDHQYC